MKLLSWGKDGGEESTVLGFWLIEVKSLFSVALLKFVGNSREAYHNHAFHSISWLLRGRLEENFLEGEQFKYVYTPSLKPIITLRNDFHKVNSVGTSWVLTFRGPWHRVWTEYRPDERRYVQLTHGREEV
jgi:hypothetical protein